MLALFPDNPDLLRNFARFQFELDGDFAAYGRRLAAEPHSPDDPDGLIVAYLAAFNTGNFIEADRVLADPRMLPMQWSTTVINDPVVLHQALVAFLRGDRVRASERAEAAIAYFRAGVWSPRLETSVTLDTALAHALAGRGDEAVRLGIAGIAQAKVQDVYEAWAKVALLGKIYVLLDRRDEAFSVLHNMLTDRSCPYFDAQRIRYDPIWSRVKDDPRFEEILKLAKPL
jgi:tetratricopeptide (TPR) repeat protein